METRLLVAYVLCALLAIVVFFAIGRYVRNRRQFKIRQSGRGKNVPGNDGMPRD
jgi:hypothetical protein